MIRIWRWPSRSKKVDLNRSSSSPVTRSYSSLIYRYRCYRILVTRSYYIVDWSRVIDDLFVITLVPMRYICLSRYSFENCIFSLSPTTFMQSTLSHK